MSDKQIATLNMENFEMLKALYDFQAVYPKTISFDEGEYFILHQTSARQRNWWQVVSMKGNIGFVPSNYVMKLKVEPEFLVGFLDSSIESLKLSKENEINGIISRDELILKLEEKKLAMKTLIDFESGNSMQNDDDDNVMFAEEHITESSSAAASNHVANGRLKNSETLQENAAVTIPEKSPKTTKVQQQQQNASKPEFHKKSMSSPAVSTQIPQLVNESPSMSVLSTKNDEPPASQQQQPQPPLSPQQQPQPQIPTIVRTPQYDNSIASEPSDTTTTTTTSDEITTVSKIETIEKIIENDKSNSPELKSPASESESAKKFIDHENNSATENTDNDQKPESLSKEKIVIGEQEVYQIVDAIRQNTNLSHELSCVALRIVLSELETILPQEALKYLEPVGNHLTGPLPAPENLLGHTHDAQRLRIIFSDLADCKNDTEQRSWMLYEDEDDICRFLRELIAILTSADQKICCHEMSFDQYQSTINLVLYYQMEPRWTIRKLVLDALKSMCYLDFTAVSIILNSVLPIEIVEDMKVSITKVARLKELAQVLTIIFSIGQKMPVTHEENLGTDFVLFLLTIIETPPDEDVNCVLPDAMINLLLSFNLQFDDFQTNIVLEAMKKITDAKTFTEKILLLINREEDPLKILTHTPPPVNSVLKMFVDLFSTKETAELFYMNDNKVLIDILVRQLSDLSPGDQLRKWYLELCRRILRNTDYPEHTHRKQDLMKIFTRIFCEETECSAKDQQLVREIANEFPQIFKA